ncbi:MAG: DNA repair protein RecO [Candidatus Magasanikbacteria bacterium]
MLKKRDHNDTDEIITFFSEEKGKIEFLAKSTKKIKSKNSYLLEPFSLLEVYSAQGKSWDRVTKLDSVKYFPELRKNTKKGLIADYSVKLIDKLTQISEKNSRVFKLLLSYLLFLQKNSLNPFVVDAFVLQLFSILGFKPDLSLIDHISGFSLKKGCFKSQNGDHIIRCNEETAEKLRRALKFDFQKSAECSLDAQMHDIIYQFGDYHLEQKLPDWRKIIK